MINVNSLVLKYQRKQQHYAPQRQHPFPLASMPQQLLTARARTEGSLRTALPPHRTADTRAHPRRPELGAFCNTTPSEVLEPKLWKWQALVTENKSKVPKG